MMFFKKNEMSLNRVRDHIIIREGDDNIKLYVDADPLRIVAGLNQAQKMMQGITDDTSEEEKVKIAEFFAAVIFGEKQAKDLMAFYHDDPACIFNICGKYFANKLAKKITKAQKK